MFTRTHGNFTRVDMLIANGLICIQTGWLFDEY